ncbi:MAG: sortase, partial [Actinomycetia bacterium]|nr:sortase [Actinomycetes bacterium]
TNHSGGRARRGRVWWGAGVGGAGAGLGLVTVAVANQDDAPEARSSGTTGSPKAVPESSAPSGSARKDTHRSAEPSRIGAKTLTASRPISIEIPAIGVASEVIKIGTNPDNSLAVPEGDDIDKAAWFENSPTPGQLGPSVIEGHIDTVGGPSVFYRLADLESGDEVRVTRADGKIAVFTVTGVRAYPTKDDFPTELVYGGDLSRSTLRLITCSNFDPSTGHYAGNTVVYSSLTRVLHSTPSN